MDEKVGTEVRVKRDGLDISCGYTSVAHTVSMEDTEQSYLDLVSNPHHLNRTLLLLLHLELQLVLFSKRCGEDIDAHYRVGLGAGHGGYFFFFSP